jgi:hypothetical protein
MARIRSIKPAFFTDEKIVECSIPARLLFIGMWVFADDAGRLEYSPKRLKMQVFPGDDGINTEVLVNELEAIRAVFRYSVAGMSYLQIRTFNKHQKISHAQPAHWPAPPELREHSGNGTGTIKEDSLNVQGTLQDDPSIDPGTFLPDVDVDVDSDIKPNAKKKKTDSRHSEFQKLLFRCHRYLNDNDTPPWDGSDAKQLSLLLKAKPDLTTKQFHIWLGNYAASENINPSSRPRKFLPKISEYASGPLDKFGKPLEEKRVKL